MVVVDTGRWQPKAFDGLSSNEVLLDNFLGVARMDEAVPDGLGIDDDDSRVFALVKAAGLVDADPALKPGRLYSILQRATKFLAVFVSAARAGGGFIPLIDADKDVVLVVWHEGWMRAGVFCCGALQQVSGRTEAPVLRE